MNTLARGMCDQACRTGACQNLGLRAGLLRPAALCGQPSRVGLAACCSSSPEQAAPAAGVYCIPSCLANKAQEREGHNGPQRHRPLWVGWMAATEHRLQQVAGYALPQQCPAEHFGD